MSKIKDEELKKIQELVSNVNTLQLQVGQLETQKHGALHQLSAIQKELGDFQKELEDSYGKVSINIQDGTYEEIKEEEVVGPEVLKNESNTED